MTTLATNHRNKLERVITEAREAAETGAKAALESMAVHHHEPYSHMTLNDRKLRNRLRIHGRQLGDHFDSKKGMQAIDHLVNECAYEHWHRMLFARFLAENDLLIEPEMGVAISLEECEELAKEQKIDSWVLASRYAQQMLPQIFRPDDPVLQVTFAREHLLKLEKLLESLEPEVFTASDAIGWVYQFWQSKKKEEVNRSGKKIGADELPAVTQLFTEPYMVSFLIHNTLGAWYAGKVLAENPDLARNAENEEALRTALALPGVSWDYLRFIRNSPSPSTGEGRGEGDGTWRPAAGTFDGWPKKSAELKVLDPCCGSGHFLVAVFLCLVALRMAEESLSAKEACNAVLRDNIFGLEIDERCTQIAAFALALAAWKYPAAGGYRSLSELNVACSGLAISAKKEDWLTLAGENTNLRLLLEELHKKFKDAPLLGSLINPEASLGEGSLFELKEDDVRPLLIKALASEKNDEKTEMGVVAQGVSKVASILGHKYNLIITNFPFIGTRKQDPVLRDYCEKLHQNAKHDLATCLIDRCIKLLQKKGTLSFVSPHNWLFLGAYRSFRIDLIKLNKWKFVAFLGSKSFQTPMYDFSIALTVITNNEMSEHDWLRGLNVEAYPTPVGKSGALRSDTILSIKQSHLLKNPDQRITLTEGSKFPLLQEKSVCITGAMNGDSPKFLKQYWEFGNRPHEWIPLQSTVTSNTPYAGRQQVIYFDKENGHLREDPIIRRTCLHNSDERGNSVWSKKGIMVHRMGSLPVTIYDGEVYDQNGAAIVPNEGFSITALWCFLASSDFNAAVRRLDNKVGVTPATLAKVPFDFDYWNTVAEANYPKGLPKPYSNDPTQWIFHGHPCGAVIWDEETKWTANGEQRTDDATLQIGIARLLGYRWPAELDHKMELSDEQREWVKKCESLHCFADDDGIVCIPSIRGEDAAAERLRGLLAAAYGSDWSPSTERELFTVAQAADLDDWLRNSFFEQHCLLFQHRPFIWHIWDGRKRDGFHALVNYHKLAEAGGKGRQLLEKLTYGYLGDWITLQKDGVKQGIGGADDRLAAALELEKRLKAILEGEPPFDIFVRWKTIEQQPIGWEPDINDGVRLNIRPFMADDIPGGKRGAGILRWKPNIKWEKDRGKDVASAPWFNLGPQYGGESGDRINDHHLTCEEKRKAREAMKKNKEKKA